MNNKILLLVFFLFFSCSIRKEKTSYNGKYEYWTDDLNEIQLVMSYVIEYNDYQKMYKLESKEKIKVTGNTVIDSLLSVSRQIDKGNLDYEKKFTESCNIDFNNKDSNYLFWYVSAAKLEPRLGERYNEQGSELEQNLGIAKMVNDLFKQIKNVDENQLICEFLLMHPEYRGIVKRIQSLKNYPFSEVQDNVLDKKTMPIDMLRFKLSFFGANRYDPKSDRWLRVSFFSGAPYLSDLNNKNVDEWGFATMSTY